MGRNNYTSDHYEDVLEFMTKAKQNIRTTPTVPPLDERRLRASLILEEALETVHGLGFELVYDGDELQAPRTITQHDLGKDGFCTLRECEVPDLVEIADGCADLSVVTIGTLIACGIPDLPLFRMVDRNNLEKFGPGHSIRPDGKLVKPPGHRSPDIKAILDQLKREGPRA